MRNQSKGQFRGCNGCRCSAEGPPKIVAIDLQPIGPIEGVQMLQGDITDEATAKQVMATFAGKKADLVVCDGAPDGLSSQHELLDL